MRVQSSCLIGERTEGEEGRSGSVVGGVEAASPRCRFKAKNMFGSFRRASKLKLGGEKARAAAFKLERQAASAC